MKRPDKKPTVTLAENIRRAMTGNLGDPYHNNSMKDFLVIFLVFVAGFLLWVFFSK